MREEEFSTFWKEEAAAGIDDLRGIKADEGVSPPSSLFATLPLRDCHLLFFFGAGRGRPYNGADI